VVESFKNSNAFSRSRLPGTGLPALWPNGFGPWRRSSSWAARRCLATPPAVTPRWDSERRNSLRDQIGRSRSQFGSRDRAAHLKPWKRPHRGQRRRLPATAVPEAAWRRFARPLAIAHRLPKPAVTQRFGRDPYAFGALRPGVLPPTWDWAPSPQPRGGHQVLGRSLVCDPKVPETRRFLGAIHLETGGLAMRRHVVSGRRGAARLLAALAGLARWTGTRARQPHGIAMRAWWSWIPQI